MPQITIETTPEEQEAVLAAIKILEGKTIAVREVAEVSGLSQSRARYALVDLIEAGKIARNATKAYNKQYVRYSYKIT